MSSFSVSLSDELEDKDYDYRHSSYRPDIVPQKDTFWPIAERVEEQARRDSLNERIKLITHNFKTATYDIDQCIRVTVPSNSFRSMAIQRWEERKSSHKTRAWSAVAITALSIGAAVAYSPLIAIASLISAVYAAIHFQRASQASTQIEGWKTDPAQKLALERKKAYENGFSHVYCNDLKLNERSHCAILLPFEVEYLFNRYYDRICTDLSAQKCVTDRQKKEWLDRFRADNPISEGVLRYVYGEVPQEYAALSRNFETIAASLRNIEVEFSNTRAQRKAEATQTINGIESQRTLACVVPNGALQYKLREARDERDRQIQIGLLDRSEIEREYEAKKSKYYAIYAAALLPINIYFDGKVREAKEALNTVLNAISQQEANAFSPYYDYAKQIVASTAAIKNKDYVYNQQPFNPSQNLQLPPLPKIEINFIYQTPPGIDPEFWGH